MKNVNNTKEKTEEVKVEGHGGNLTSHRSANWSEEEEERPWEPFDDEKHLHLTKIERNNLIYI